MGSTCSTCSSGANRTAGCFGWCWIARRRGPETTAEESVTIDDCRRVSVDLSTHLDVDPALVGDVDRKYTLEVSSPGLDRPLRGEADYRRFAGRLAKIVTREPVDGQSHFAGRLTGIEDGHVLLTKGGACTACRSRRSAARGSK